MADLRGFACPGCEIVGWPFRATCPQCHTTIPIAVTITDVTPDDLRDARALLAQAGDDAWVEVHDAPPRTAVWWAETHMGIHPRS